MCVERREKKCVNLRVIPSIGGSELSVFSLATKKEQKNERFLWLFPFMYNLRERHNTTTEHYASYYEY